MSEKKYQKHKNGETTELPSEGEEMPQSGEHAPMELETLMQRLGESEAKVAEHLDGWQRSQAEFVNYKNRVQRDQESMRNYMKGDLVRRFLPVLDDLERALQNRPTDDPWVNGIELIARKIQSILESEGVKRIEVDGQMFDPRFHEAISHEMVEGVESGRVIALVQNGYMLGDHVIRPALVKVAQ
jgi:molecular chaperone GrpE